jgi:hypothetical protein
VLPRENFERLFKKTPQLRLNMDVAVRSRHLARTLRFKWLRRDEVIYFLARKHPVVLYEMLILPGACPDRAVWPVLCKLLHRAAVHRPAGGNASLLAVVGWIVWTVIDWGNDYYIVTNQRVVWLEKVIGIYDSRQESPLSTILSVSVETGQLGRILDYGDVIIRTFVGKIAFTQVTHPEQAQHMIEEYWNRTKAQATSMEKEAMKNAIRKRIGDSRFLPRRKLIHSPKTTLRLCPSPDRRVSTPSFDCWVRAPSKCVMSSAITWCTASTGWCCSCMPGFLSCATLGLIFLLLWRLIELAFDPARVLFSSPGRVRHLGDGLLPGVLPVCRLADLQGHGLEQ